ncbi:MAG TPA: type II toxin-antitoxin system CcdA family antitoxin [Gammaproteobacteria bacterium]|nr:type II toxin-antitoxin system CcdA family antitoxin [Gammaproteobacteria bacterium]
MNSRKIPRANTSRSARFPKINDPRCGAESPADARSTDVNASATLGLALTDKAGGQLRKRWLTDNLSSIEAYNEGVIKEGVFSDGLRNF